MENGAEAEVEIDFPDGKRTIMMVHDDEVDFEDIAPDQVALLILRNQKQYTGIFKGMDEETILLQPLGGGRSIGLDSSWVMFFFVEKKDEDDSIS